MSDEIDESQDKEEDAGDDWGAALSEQADAEAGVAEEQDQSDDVGYESAEMESLQADPSVIADDVNLDVILEIPVTLSMEIGRTEISIRNLLQLNQGSVVELDRLAGEPMDVMVNGTLVAHGEVVVVNEKFGIRLTDIISPQERVKKLR